MTDSSRNPANQGLAPWTYRFLGLNPGLKRCFSGWDFPVGTALGDRAFWWAPGGMRPHPHEGIDFYYFFDQAGRQRCLSSGLLIPALASGTVIGIHRDFLAWTVLIRHDCSPAAISAWDLYSLYGHLVPEEELRPGCRISAGEPLGHIGLEKEEAKVPAHLHLSLVRLRRDCALELLRWEKLAGAATFCTGTENAGRSRLMLLDPRRGLPAG